MQPNDTKDFLLNSGCGQGGKGERGEEREGGKGEREGRGERGERGWEGGDEGEGGEGGEGDGECSGARGSILFIEDFINPRSKRHKPLSRPPAFGTLKWN